MKIFKLTHVLGAALIGLASFSSCTVDDCKNVVCNNGGTCVLGSCTCPDGFSGTNCETDHCAALTCNATGGNKVATAAGCDCTCNAGYEGADCATEKRAAYVGTFNVAETCSQSTDTYAVVITNGATVNDVVIANIYDEGVNVNATVNVADGGLTIASQAFGNGTISGTVTKSGTVITISFTLVLGSDTDTCTSVSQ